MAERVEFWFGAGHPVISAREAPLHQADQLAFGPFRLDVTAKRLWRDRQEIPLQPQPLAVLQCLAERGGRLVTKEELLREAWQGTWVSKTALKVCVHAIRVALGDDVADPRYIETVGRLGYRFLCAGGAGTPAPAASAVVARDREVDRLRASLARAQRGRRQVVFVTGEPGIGKSTVVDLFLDGLRADADVSCARGQCLDQYGEGEPYLPLLEALGQLCHGPRARQVLDVLCRFAPTWVVQMPALVRESELDALRARVAGASRDRMLREMAEALAALAAERTLVLVFEDLHWSDPSTVALIAYLARRREAARLMLVGTYRSADLVVQDHPLKGVKHELQAHGLCDELLLELLREQDVAAYVAQRWSGSPAPLDLARRVYQRSDGNPLFMVNLVEHYLRQGRTAASSPAGGDADDVPDSLQQMIAQQIAALPDEIRQVLEVASVDGMEFAAAHIAGALDRAPDAVEDVCDELAHEGRFLREAGVASWPDGTVSSRYGFRHALYQQVLYRRLPEARRTRLHRAIAERAEAAYGERAGELAGTLAAHFERGRDERRALAYRRKAVETALRRNAYPEAIEHLERCIALVRAQPATPERARDELGLTLALAPLLQYTHGYGAAETERAYARARDLSARVDDPVRQFPALLRLAYYALVRTRLGEAREAAERCLAIARRMGDPQRLADAHHALGCTLFWLGTLEPARQHLAECVAVLDPRRHRWTPLGPGLFAPGSLAVGQLGWTLWLLGQPDRSIERTREAVDLARELGYPLNIGSTLAFAATVHQQRREVQAAAEYVDAQLALAAREGYPHWLVDGGFKRAWVLAERGEHAAAHDELRRVLATSRAAGPAVAQSYHVALAAEVLGTVGRPREGLEVVAGWLDRPERSEECYYDAELVRLRGELLCRVPGRKRASAEAAAEACFRHGLAIAREQGARALELRAATSLARLWRAQRKQAAARSLLGEVLGGFHEGFGTADLRDARALLDGA